MGIEAECAFILFRSETFSDLAKITTIAYLKKK